MRIALDAMAGDFGPEPLVKGAIQAVEETRHHVILVGDAEVLENILNREHALHPRLSIVHADTVVGMDEAPKASLRKRTSSLAVARPATPGPPWPRPFSAGAPCRGFRVRRWPRSFPSPSIRSC
jgi:fatty acid/phospholipid biosynthesis enzyme